ncbi:Cell cycle control protein [Trachipleistophora hominis]|uniref:Cell cycle control protein n=1 Tax=Trachipleistophora hominis TaxID=72359 RepID=L7JVT1_TRAHO|nr:Cell cycle control protein [Trachipleistophora hominis]
MLPLFNMNIRRVLEERTVGFGKPSLNLFPFYVLLSLACISLSIILGYIHITTFQAVLPSSGTITVPRKMTLNLYIRFYDFSQNHILYARSISLDQLRGKKWTDLDRCKPIIRNEGTIVYPCGLVSDTLPFDNVALIGSQGRIEPSTTGIAKNAHKKKIKALMTNIPVTKPPSWPNRTGTLGSEQSDDQVIDLSENERFVNWIQIAAFSRFKKLFGRFDDLEKGDYDVVVDQKGELGRRSVVLREKRLVDVDSYWLPVYLMVGGIFILFPVLLK